MATANDGISRFSNSTVYGTPTFATAPTFSAGIVTPSVTSTVGNLTLSSGSGIFFGGDLLNQDISLDAPVVYTTPLPFMCSILCTAAANSVVIPEVYDGGRIIFTNNTGGNVTLDASGASQFLVVGTGQSATVTVATGTAYMLVAQEVIWLAIRLV
jgi:hypothetical protein